MLFEVSSKLPLYRETPNESRVQLRRSLAMLAGAVAVIAGGLGATGMVRATVINDPNTITIYQDTFNRGSNSSLTLLDGSTPTIDNYTGSPTWTAYSGTVSSGTYAATNGSQLIILNPTSNQPTGTLPFTPQAGHIYDLSSTFAYTGANGLRADWMAVAYTKGATRTGLGTVNPWLLQRGEPTTNGTGVQAYEGSMISVGNSPAANTFDTYDVVLNTTNPAWNVQYYQNGSLLASYVETTNPTGINGVTWSVTPSVDINATNFELTDTPVPDPTPLAFFAAGGLALLAIRRRRRSA